MSLIFRPPHLFHIPIIAVFFALVSCSGETSPAEGEKGSGNHDASLSVYTTFYPTEYFAKRIGGDLVQVVCPVPDGEDAIFWKPDAAAIQSYQKADLIVLNGAGFAKWVAQVSLPENRVIDTARPFESEFVRYETAASHSHGGKGEHTHEGIDGHTWLDPVNAKVQASEIFKALKARIPNHVDDLGKRYRALCEDLDKLDEGLKSIDPTTPLLASHPAYNYLVQRYKWKKLRNLDLDPEEMPSDQVFASIREGLEEHPTKIILWEGEPNPEIAKRFADELGLKSVVFSPCELLKAEERSAGVDYLSVMRDNLKRLSDALQ